MRETRIHSSQLDNVQTRDSAATELKSSDNDADLTLWQAFRKWDRVCWYCMGLTFAILMFGYDYVVVGTTSAMPSFQRDYGQQLDGRGIIPSLWLALWNIASPCGSMVGSITGGHLQERVGRRYSMALGSFLSAVGVAIMYVSYLPDDINARRGVFLAGKGFQGAAIGMVMASVQTYMSEVLPAPLRGSMLVMFPIFTLVGQLIGAAVIYSALNLQNGYIICFASQWPFSAVPLIMAFIVPESPVYLIRKNKVEKAYKSQMRLLPRGSEVEAELQLIRENINMEKGKHKSGYKECFQGTNTRRTLIVMFANMLPQFFGLSLLAKASYFGQIIGMNPRMSILLLLMGLVVGLLANGCSVWLISRIGRRRLAISSLSVLILLWTALGISGCWDGTFTVWFTAAMLILITIVASLGVWPVSFAVGAETSALHLRSQTQGLGWFTSGGTTALFGFVLPYIFNPDKGNLRGKTGFVFAGLCAVASAIMFLYIPEMRGRTVTEINTMFELRLPARKFKSWKPLLEESTQPPSSSNE